MNVLSLFDWISCWRLALDRAWIEVDNYYASEIDKFASAVTAYRRPNTIPLWDATKRKERDIDRWSIDLLFWGFPCQTRSIAWKWLWDKDPRWQLMRTMLDILEHIRSLNPNVKFLFENVKMKKEFLEYINEAIGVEPVLINSALLSAQNRKRYYRCNFWPIEQPKDKWIVLKDVLLHEVDEKYYLSEEYHERFKKSNLVMNWAIKVVWTTVWTGKRTNSRHRVHTDEWKIWTLSATDYKQPKQIIKKSIRVWQIGKWWQWDRIYSDEWKSVALSANWWGRWAKTWLYSIKQKWRWFNKWWLHSDKSPTLTINSWEQNNHVAEERLAIRKLTPVECEKLQTIPVNYTLVPRQKRMMSDSQRYKQVGNWRTIDVICYILKSLL